MLAIFNQNYILCQYLFLKEFFPSSTILKITRNILSLTTDKDLLKYEYRSQFFKIGLLRLVTDLVPEI